jgi:hypothetical protein
LVDNYGYSIGVGSNTILVGAPKEDNSTFESAGKVFSYYKQPGSFNWCVK